jgi:hypothetical protein
VSLENWVRHGRSSESLRVYWRKRSTARAGAGSPLGRAGPGRVANHENKPDETMEWLASVSQPNLLKYLLYLFTFN